MRITVAQREIEDNAYAIFFKANNVYYGRSANGKLSINADKFS